MQSQTVSQEFVIINNIINNKDNSKYVLTGPNVKYRVTECVPSISYRQIKNHLRTDRKSTLTP